MGRTGKRMTERSWKMGKNTKLCPQHSGVTIDYDMFYEELEEKSLKFMKIK
jgi:hypothetical protein